MASERAAPMKSAIQCAPYRSAASVKCVDCSSKLPDAQENIPAAVDATIAPATDAAVVAAAVAAAVAATGVAAVCCCFCSSYVWCCLCFCCL